MKILIYRIGSIGDTVVALPALKYIKQKYFNADIAMLTNIPVSKTGKESSVTNILNGTNIVDKYIEYSITEDAFSKFFSLRDKIIAYKPDVLIYLMPLRKRGQLLRDLIFFKLCGIKKIIGLNFFKHANTRLFNPNTELWEHESHRLGRLLTDGDIDYTATSSWTLNLSYNERETGRKAILGFGTTPFIAFSLGAKCDINQWGDIRWCELMSRLTEKYRNYGLVLIGSHDEYERCEMIGKQWRGPVLNFCGQLSPRDSASVLELATVFLGQDSGPMHLAAVVGTCVVSIFSARNKPGEWYPYGNQHRIIYHKTNCFGCALTICTLEKKKCIDSISIDEVFDAAVLSIDSVNNFVNNISHDQQVNW